jgi:hypothetical protein
MVYFLLIFHTVAHFVLELGAQYFIPACGFKAVNKN